MKLQAVCSKLLLAVVAIASSLAVAAQSKADIFDETKEVTWLGLDFSQATFIGKPYQFKESGEISDEEFVDKYAPGWNQLFIDEPKKFKVAEAVHRSSVKYATEITEKANSKTKNKQFQSSDPDHFKKLDEAKIKSLVKGYDFKANKGVGLIFFVDGMSKGKEEASAWVTFVDMGSKTVLLTEYKTGKAGGFGFRNYWAKSFNEILKEIKDSYKNWKKG